MRGREGGGREGGRGSSKNFDLIVILLCALYSQKKNGKPTRVWGDYPNPLLWKCSCVGRLQLPQLWALLEQ